MKETTSVVGDEDSLIGRQIGKFRIIERLGEGGMGVVYRAEDVSLGRVVALKTLTTDRMDDPSRKRRLLREARSLGALSHPAIATIHEVGEADGVAYIAMELVGGQSLKTRLERGPLPASEAVPLFIAIADALAHAHDKAIIHRDLKPSNVMLTDSGSVKLLDFGIAKMLEDEGASEGNPTTHEGQVLGTPAFMSPEQARGDRTDERSDVFSLGSLMYAAVSGRPPFDEETPYETVVAVYRRTPPHLGTVAPQVPSSLRDLIHRCMRKDADRRPQRADAVRTELELLPADVTMTIAGGVPRAAEPEVQPRSYRWAWVGGGIALAAVLLLVGLWKGSAGSSPSSPALDASTALPSFELRRLTELSVQNSLHHAALSLDGEVLAYVTRRGLWVKRVDSAEPRRVGSPALTGAISVAFFPDNRRLLVAGVSEGGEGEMWIVPIEPGEPQRVYSGQIAYSPEVSPKGDAFLYSTTEGLYVQSLDEAGSRRLIRETSDYVIGSWSPRGDEIAFLVLDQLHVGDDARGEVWLARADGSNNRRVYAGDRLYGGRGTSKVSWLNASTIVFASFRGRTTLWAINTVEDSEPLTIYEWPGETVLVAWTGGGGVMVFRDSSDEEVRVAQVEHGRVSSARVLSVSGTGNRVHAWTRDGRIVFAERKAGRIRLLVIDPETDVEQVIAEDVVKIDGSAPSRNGVYFWVRDVDGGWVLRSWDHSTGTAEDLWRAPSTSVPHVSCASGLAHYCLVSEYVNGVAKLRELMEDGSLSQQLLGSNPFIAGAHWSLSPDGRRVAWLTSDAHVRMTTLLTGATVEVHVVEGAQLLGISWGFDETLLGYAAWVPGHGVGAILLLGANQAPQVIWSSDVAGPTGAAMSPDGQRLAYSTMSTRIDAWLLTPTTN